MPHRAQSANRLTERIHAQVRAALGDSPPSHLLVACSGGADSSCLARAVAIVASTAGAGVTIGHVRHGVRPDDGEDLAVVRSLALALTVSFASVVLSPLADGACAGISEGGLRTRRYAALAQMARAVGAGAILTGHTMDDQAETVLLHLFRGAGIDGLAGIRWETERDDLDGAERDPLMPALRVIRPLLGIRRSETVAYCAAHDLHPMHDPTNDDETWARNWMRHTILPAIGARNPDIVGTLACAATTVARDADFLRAQTEQALHRCLRCEREGAALLDRKQFADEAEALQVRIVRALAVRYTGTTLRADIAEQAWRSLLATRSTRIMHHGLLTHCLLGGDIAVGTRDGVQSCVLSWAAQRYPLFRGEVDVASVGEFRFPPFSATDPEYALTLRPAVLPSDATRLAGISGEHPLAFPTDAHVTMRNRMPGDRIRPIGHTTAVSLGDFLHAHQIPEPMRDLLPLLVVNDRIVGVIGVGWSADFATDRAAATHIAALERRSDSDDGKECDGA